MSTRVVHFWVDFHRHSKATKILAAVELAKRLNALPKSQPPIIHSPEDVANLVMSEMRYLDRGHFRAILLNSKNHVLKIELIGIGTLNSSSIHPRELFKTAIKNSAAAVILVHNHPSGDPIASKEDEEVTERLVEVDK